MADSRKNQSGVYLAAVSAIFGLVILYLSGGESEVPARGTLVSATGQVQSVIKGKSSVKFSLQGDAHHFQFLSRSGALPPVHQALSGAGVERVTVLYDPAQNWQPPLDDKAYHTVYEIRVSDHNLVSYEQARVAWQRNQGLGTLLGLVFLLGGAAWLIFARIRQGRR